MIHSLDERRPSRRCRSTRMTRYGTDWKARRLSALESILVAASFDPTSAAARTRFSTDRRSKRFGHRSLSRSWPFEGNRRRRSAGSIVFDLDALEVVDESTEREVPSAVTSASFTAPSSRLLAPPPVGPATGAADVVLASAEANVVLPDVKTVPLYEEGGETVCRSMTRPGSRIAETVCYTREEELARQATSNRTVADLAREQQWREQAIHEAAMKNRYPGVVGTNSR